VLSAAAILEREGIEPVMQVTCRDRNRIALQSLLVGAAALGVRNLLVLRGDDPKAGDQPDAKPVFDLDSIALLGTAKSMRDRGELPNGRVVGGKLEFFIGAADSPLDPPADWEPAALRRKADAGAQFVQTQFCMDVEVLRRYLTRLAAHGLTERLHILVGIAPLSSARSARWIREHLYGAIIPDSLIARLEAAADPKLEGRRICVELMLALQGVPGVAGVHLMAPLDHAALPLVLSDYRSTAPNAQRAKVSTS
jgi:methylenetetrahydrofolate reductase (NADPH)